MVYITKKFNFYYVKNILHNNNKRCNSKNIENNFIDTGPQADWLANKITKELKETVNYVHEKYYGNCFFFMIIDLGYVC